EEARALLGSKKTSERNATTLELWKNGTTSLPLLSELADDADPEVANRARFILRRLRMGLQPTSSPDLLQLAVTLEQALPDQRAARLDELLDHHDGAPIALALLDHWAEKELAGPKNLVALASLVTQSLLEQRGRWEDLFTTHLSPPCRAAMIVEVAKQDLPMKPQIIAILAKAQTALVYQKFRQFTKESDQVTLLALARTALIGEDLPLALEILQEGLPTTPDPDLARALAFLEASSGSPATPYEGPWQDELKIFRARLRGDQDEVLRLNQGLKNQQFLRYENHLMVGLLELPSRDEDDVPPPAELGLKALHTAFGDLPGEPDIEALSAAVLLDWSVLARTLSLLGSPREASETLSANRQSTSAVNLLWRTNHREEALALAQETLNNFDGKEETKMRITLATLHLEAGEKEEAQKIFEPLLSLKMPTEIYRSKAITLGLQIFSREELLTLAPGLNAKLPYQRASEIAPFLPYPDKVSVTWYELFLVLDPLQSPLSIFKKVEDFLNGDQKEARKITAKSLAESSKKTLLPSDSLYQNVLFLKLPEALAMVQKAAWYQLSTRDLSGIIRDETWPEETRRAALETALLISPTDIALRWHQLQLTGGGESQALHHLILANPALALQLGALTGKRKTLELSAAVANLKDYRALQCLVILGKSYLKNEQPADAARFLQAALCGEVAAGNQPATLIKATLENLIAYLEARAALADDEVTKEIWHRRLRAIR
ncbi:MAG: hypothetical protein ACI9AF_001382, partial [Granulosicoccus sp.]